MTNQLSNCCKAEIYLNENLDRPECFTCSKCWRVIGTPQPNSGEEVVEKLDLDELWKMQELISIQEVAKKVNKIIEVNNNTQALTAQYNKGVKEERKRVLEVVEGNIKELLVRYSAKDDFVNRESFAEFVIYNLKTI